MRGEARHVDEGHYCPLKQGATPVESSVLPTLLPVDWRARVGQGSGRDAAAIRLCACGPPNRGRRLLGMRMPRAP